MNERSKEGVAAALDEAAAHAVPDGVDLRPAIHARLKVRRPALGRGAGARRAALALVVLLAAGLAGLLLVPDAGARLVNLVAPQPVTFHATLTFTPPLSLDAFKAFVHETGVLPTQNRLQATDAQGMTVSIGAAGQWAHDASGRELDGTPQPGGDGIDTEHLQRFLGDKPITGLVVLSSDVILDRAIYARVQHDPRVALDSGSPQPPTASADAVVARWKTAFAAVHTLRGRQAFALVHADGSAAAAPPSMGLPTASDEVFELTGNSVGRYRVDQQIAGGDLLTIWDGAHAYRYWSWLHEVYRPQPESQSAYWMDDLDDLALPYFLRPASGGYNLVGPTQLDGRAVIELVVKGGHEGPAGLDGTRVWLDAAGYLPVRITVYTPGAQVGLQRTFTDLRINTPPSDVDFAFTPPPGTRTVYEQAYMAPHLATYKTLDEAAQAAEVPLFAPATLQTGDIYAQYVVEQDGRRSPVIALNQGAILEGRTLPVDPGARSPGVTPAQPLTIAGQPATLQAGVLTFARGETQIRLSGVQGPADAAQKAAALQPVVPGVTLPTAAPDPRQPSPTGGPLAASPTPGSAETPARARTPVATPDDGRIPGPLLTPELPTPPPLPTPPAGPGAGGPDAWARIAAQVPYPLYVPAPDSGLVATHGPYRADFPLEAGEPGTYPGVAATYQVAATGETVTVVQMAGWPGDKGRFGQPPRAGRIDGFYYEDAVQRRLIFQPASPNRATDLMLRAPAGVSQDALLALAAGMQPLPYPAATATPPDPASAVIQIQDLSFADAQHGWVLQARCLGDIRPCATFIRATTDGGQTWPRQHPVPGGDLRALRLVSAQDGWVYGPDGGFGTHDGGATWQAGPAGGQVVQVQPVGQGLWAIQQACPAPNRPNCPLRLLSSPDQGRTWVAAPTPPGLRGAARLVTAGGSAAWLVVDLDPGGTDAGLLLASHDGGQSWQPRVNPCTPGLGLRQDLATAPGQLWMACAGYPGAGQVDQDKSLYRSADDGRQWALVAHHAFGAPQPDERDPAPGDLPLMAVWGLAAPAPDQLWLVLADGWLSRSVDGGRSWHRVDLPYDRIGSYGLGPLVFLDARTGWVAGRTGLFRTTDGGAHWTTALLP